MRFLRLWSFLASPVFLAIVSIVAISSAIACIHVPANFGGGAVVEKLKEGFLFRDEEFAHLVVRTTLTISDKLPPTMAWVIPLPTVPVKMEVIGESIFRELFAMTRPTRVMLSFPPPSGVPVPAPAAAPEDSGTSGIRVHEVTVAGHYALQPIEILNEEAGLELNVWLQANGFGTVPAENQRYYLKKGAAFIAVKMRDLAGAEATAEPLHFVYRSPRLAMPLKFSTHSGAFDLVLYTLTPERPQDDALGRYHLEARRTVEVRGSDPALAGTELKKLIRDQAGWLTRYYGIGYNTSNQMVAILSADPELGDYAPGAHDALSRELLIRIAAAAGFGIVAVVLLFFMRQYFVKRSKPWRKHYAIAVTCAGVLAVGSIWLTERSQIRSVMGPLGLSIGMYAYPLMHTISENAVQKKSLADATAGLTGANIPAGYSLSRDGVISIRLEPPTTETFVRVVLSPTLNGDHVEWSCELLPKAAERYAPFDCREP